MPNVYLLVYFLLILKGYQLYLAFSHTGISLFFFFSFFFFLQQCLSDILAGNSGITKLQLNSTKLGDEVSHS